MRPLETRRLTLEPQTAAHAREMFAVLSDPAIYLFEGEPPPSLEWLRARFERLQTRRSSDGREQWLNWVVRLASAPLIGYVQATIRTGGDAMIAYEFASAYWGRGFAHEATSAMIDELIVSYRVASLSAVAKRANTRSLRLLDRLGFSPAGADEHGRRAIAADEALMLRAVVRRN